MNNRKKKPQMEMLNMSCFAHYESELHKEHELKMKEIHIGTEDYKNRLRHICSKGIIDEKNNDIQKQIRDKWLNR